MYLKIYNPITKRMVNLKTDTGRKLLSKYLHTLYGGDSVKNSFKLKSTDDHSIYLMKLILNSYKLDKDITVYSALLPEIIKNPDKKIDRASLNDWFSLSATVLYQCVIQNVTGSSITWWKDRHCYKITIPKGTPILPIFNSEDHFNEFEILLPPYFKLVKDDSVSNEKCYFPYFDSIDNWKNTVDLYNKEYEKFILNDIEDYGIFFYELAKIYKLNINNKNSLYYRIVDNSIKNKLLDFVILCDLEGNLAWIESYINNKSDIYYYLKRIISKDTDSLDLYENIIYNVDKVDITKKLVKLDFITSLVIDEFGSEYKYYDYINNEYIFYNLKKHNNLIELMNDIKNNYSVKPILEHQYKYFTVNLYGYIFIKKFRDTSILEECKTKSIDNYKFVLEYNPEEANRSINTHVKDNQIYERLLKEVEENEDSEDMLYAYDKRLDSCLLNTIITSINIGLPVQDTDIINYDILKKCLYEYIYNLNKVDNIELYTFGQGVY